MQNSVVTYLHENPNSKLSKYTLRKRLQLNNRVISSMIRSALSSEKIRRVDPLEIGCYKHRNGMAVFQAVKV